MTIPQMLIPSTRRRAFARRALRASSLLCALGLLGAAACSDNTGDDVIADSPNSGNAIPRPDVSRAPTTTPGTNTANDTASGTQVDNDESGIDDSSDIAARSGTRSTAGGGGSRRRSRDDEEITTDAGVEVDAGEADAGDVEVVEDAGVIVVDAGDAG